MSLDPQTLRAAFGTFPTGVTVVTTRTPDGQPVGFTANSFTSVSLDPPLLLVCPGRFLSSHDIFRACTRFAVNVLAEGQEDVSNIFAGYRGDRFAKVDWHDDSLGTPVLTGAAASFSCMTEEARPAGDHTLLLGRIVEASRSGARGLGYVDGGYFSLGLERDTAAPHAGVPRRAGVLLDFDDQILLTDTPDGLAPPIIDIAAGTPVRSALIGLLEDHRLPARLGQAYSIYDAGGEHLTFIRATAHGPDTGGLGHFVPVTALSSANFATPAFATMLTRFAADYANRDFGLYVGDAQRGDILPNEGDT